MNESRQSEVPAGDELDDLFDYAAGIDDILNDGHGAQASRNQPSEENGRDASGVGLGIDEEVKIAKKRQPVAKLDDARLLSAAGIPKLRKISKERLRFKGKGHEFSDIARLLNMYQLWLDDLYPRANFSDALSIIEKLGHSKRIQMMRKQWIDESKPRPAVEVNYEEAESLDGDAQGEGSPSKDPPNAQLPAQPTQIHQTITGDVSRTESTGNAAVANSSGEPDEDELDALLAEDDPPPTTQPNSLFGPGKNVAPPQQQSRLPPEEDDFADELEAMTGIDYDW